jgi:hypothetical protein
MANMSVAIRPPLFPFCYDGLDVLAQCYAGTCVNGSCVCDPGWSGWTDYTPMDLSEWGGPVLSCGVFNPVVKVLWCLVLIPGVMNMITLIPALREQYKVFTKKRNRGKWYQHVPLLVSAIAVPIEFMSLFALVGMKLAMDGKNLIGVHKAPSIIFAISSLNMNIGVMMNDLVLLRSAMRSPLARGGQAPAEIEARIRKLTTNRVLSALPIFFLDVSVLVSICIVPAPGPDDPVLLLKRVVVLVRVVHLVVCISFLYLNAWKQHRITSLMFKQVRCSCSGGTSKEYVSHTHTHTHTHTHIQKVSHTHCPPRPPPTHTHSSRFSSE